MRESKDKHNPDTKHCFPIPMRRFIQHMHTGWMNKYSLSEWASEGTETGLTHIFFYVWRKKTHRNEKWSNTQQHPHSTYIHTRSRSHNFCTLHCTEITAFLIEIIEPWPNLNPIQTFDATPALRRNKPRAHIHTERDRHGAPMHTQHYKYLYTCFKFSRNRHNTHKVQVRKNTAEREKTTKWTEWFMPCVKAREAIVCCFYFTKGN